MKPKTIINILLWLSLAGMARAGEVHLGDGNLLTDNHLPSYASYQYSYSQQIYTADEIGRAGVINSLALYATGYAVTRLLDIYLVPTDKTAFSGSNNWIPVSAAYMVFSGEVSFVSQNWTMISLQKAFVYDGIHNLTLVVNDRTGSTRQSVYFSTYSSENSSIYTASNNTPFNLTTMGTSGGSLLQKKNELRLAFDDEGGTCMYPTNVRISGLTDRLALIEWDSDGNSWNLQYRASIATEWIEQNGLTTPEATLYGLSPNTLYDVRVQTVCGGGAISYWTLYQFTTEGTFPYEQTFDTSLPTNWSKAYSYSLSMNDNGLSTYMNDSDGWLFGSRTEVSDNHAYLNLCHDLNWHWLKTQRVPVKAGAELSFDLALTQCESHAWPIVKGKQPTDEFNVLISIDEGQTWNVLRQWNNSGSEYVFDDIATNGEHVRIDLNNYVGKTVVVSFVGGRENYGGHLGYDVTLHLDNICFDYVSTCQQPAVVNVSDVTLESALVSWTPAGTATQWDILVNAGRPDELLVTNVNEPHFMLTGLEPATVYTVQVRANGGGGRLSAWSTKARFHTLFGTSDNHCTITYELRDSWGDGWDGCALLVVDEATNVLLDRWAFDDGSSARGSLDVCCGRTVLFYCQSNGGKTSECSYSVYDVNGDEIFSGEGYSLEPYSYTVDCTMRSCRKPTELTAIKVRPNSIELSWKENGNASRWQLCINDDETNLIEVDRIPFTLTGLILELNYNIKVRAREGTETSVWSEPIKVYTEAPCPMPSDIAVVPLQTSAMVSWTGCSENYILRYRKSTDTSFFDDFEHGLGKWTVYTMGTAPYDDGWVYYNREGDTQASSVLAYGGTHVAASWSWWNGPYEADNWLITPVLSLSGTVKFYVITNGSTPDSFEVLLSTQTSGLPEIEDFRTTLRSMQAATGQWRVVTIDLSDYAGQQGYIAIHHKGTAHGYLFIDDFGLYTTGSWTRALTDETSIELTGLEPATEYQYQLQGICDGTPTEWTYTESFTTLDKNVKVFTTAGNWNVAKNWSPAGVPTKDDNIVLLADVTIPAGVVAYANKVDCQNHSITLCDGGQLWHETNRLTVIMEKHIKGYGSSKRADGYCFFANDWSLTVNPAEVLGLRSGDYDLYGLSSNQSQGLKWTNYKLPDSYSGFQGYLYASKNEKTLKMRFESLGCNQTTSHSGALGNLLMERNPFTYNCYIYVTNKNKTELLHANFYKLNAAGDGYVHYEDQVPLAPGEGCLIQLFPGSNYIRTSTTSFIGETSPEVADASYLPVLPKHGEITHQDATPTLTLAANTANSAIIEKANGHTCNVMLAGRTLNKNGGWNPICLPFDLKLEGSILNGAIARTFKTSRVSTGKKKTMYITFDDAVTELKAGEPYLIKWDEASGNLVNPVFPHVIMKKDILPVQDTYVDFMGNFDPVAFGVAGDRTKFYIYGSNQIVCATKMQLGAFHAYFQLQQDLTTDEMASSYIAEFNVDFGDGFLVSVNDLKDDHRSEEGEWYMPDGRKVGDLPAQRGLYINKGRKVVVK